MRDESVHAPTGVVADLEHPVDIVRRQVEHVPGLERGRRPGGTAGETFSGFPLPWLSRTITSVAPAASSPSAAAAVSASIRGLPVAQYSGRHAKVS